MRPNFNEIAGIQNGRDITRGWVDGYFYLPTQDPILNLKSGGDLNLYEKVLEDYQVKSCLQQRFSKLTSKKVEVLPGGTKEIDKKAAEAMLAQLKRLPWDDITKKMLMGVHYGYSLGEVVWQANGDAVDIQAIKVRNRRRFKFNADFQPLLITYSNPMGEILPDRKFWYFKTGADNDDEPDGRGLAFWLYWLVWFKKNDIRWWITFLENFAEPSRVGKYPTGSTPEEKKTLENAVQMLGRHKWATMPEGMLYELIEASRSGTADYQAMVETIDSAISKIIVGQTMTTDNGSSRSQAEVHENVGNAVTHEDNDLLSDSLQNLSRWWTKWNYPGAQPPIITRKMSEMDLSAEADKDAKLQGLGISLKPEAIAAKYGDDYLVPDNKEQTPQLNGEQVNALVSIVTSAKQGAWKPELVAGMINGAFPNWPDEAVAAITDNLESDVPEGAPAQGGESDSTEAPDLESVASMFAAPKKKNCKTGISCGNTCISGQKMCVRDLSPSQKQLYAELKKAAGKGGAEAKVDLDKFRADVKKEAEEPNPYEGDSLGDLYLEADRIGKKYQSQAEIDAYNEAYSKAANEIDDLIDELYPDNAPSPAIGYTKPEVVAKTQKVKKKVASHYVSAMDRIQKMAADRKAAEQESKSQKPVDPEPESNPAERQKAYFVDVKSIKTDSKASDFDPAEIDSIANSILEAGGLYRPLLVEQDGVDYKLLPGHEIGYHAAVRAKELNLAKGEMVNAFVVAKDYTSESASQIDRLKKSEAQVAEPTEQFAQPFRMSGLRDDKAMFVDVKSINSSRPASDFDPKEIEALADSMLANGGLLRPIVLGQKTFDTYEVVDGHLAYHASVLAKQKDIKRGEMVNAFVVSPENMDNVVKQLKALEASAAPKTKKTKSLKLTAEAAIEAIESSDMRKMDKQSATSGIKKLDFSKESHAAYAKAAIETAGFYKKQKDGQVIDTDSGGTTSSFDRSNELMRVLNRKQISDDEASDAGDSLRQGLRGGNGSAVNQANTLLGRDIFVRLSNSQKKAFAVQMSNSMSLLEDDSDFKKELAKYQ